MSNSWHVEVDRGRCESSGMCEGAAPEYFALDEEGKARPRQSVAAGSDMLLMAAACCPAEAIRVTDRETGEQLAPPE